MTRLIVLLALILPAGALAEAFQRPIPQPQTATAEWWFFAASVALIGALVAVHMLVRRR
jgi:hypothetical protein